MENAGISDEERALESLVEDEEGEEAAAADTSSVHDDSHVTSKASSPAIDYVRKSRKPYRACVHLYACASSHAMQP